MKRRIARTVPVTDFYTSVVREALAIAAAYTTGGVERAMHGEARRERRGARRERLGALRERLEAKGIAQRAS